MAVESERSHPGTSVIALSEFTNAVTSRCPDITGR